MPARLAQSVRRVALIERRGRFLLGEPVFEPGPHLPLGRNGLGSQGEMVLIEQRGGKARVLRELGSPERARDVVEALLWERLGRGFPSALEDEAADAAALADPQPARRRDLTELATFTVDPVTARDFDDAVSARREGERVRLWIHIADVSAFVRPGSPLDREALNRANSTYVPGSVEPMLPAALSAGACSLAAGPERLAVTAELELDGQGAPLQSSFYRSRIRSDARLSYDQLDGFFAAREEPPEAIAEPLGIVRAVAAELARHRASSELSLSSREPEFSFDSEGELTGARSVEQTESHRLIERLMILTNEQVAGLLERKRVPSLYRVHEQPDAERIRLLFDQMASLDLPTPPLPERFSGPEAGRLTAEASRMLTREIGRRGHGRDAYTALLLRSLRQAHYSDQNVGHAGLGSPAYCHFTSPIRRYPDLLCHRALLSVIGQGEPAPRSEETQRAGWHCSEREREAVRIERDADDICAAFLLRAELAERGVEQRFEGEVSGVIGAGAFVAFAGEHADLYEGFLPARRLGSERYELNALQTALVGTRSSRALRLGDPVAVAVERIDAPRGRVDLSLADG